MIENRTSKRVVVDLKTLVQVKESDEETWKEVARVHSISRQGAGFELTRPCKVGRLVALVMPMPTEFRAYDRHEEAYAVMGLVQYCKEVTEDETTVYHVGVAFTGKEVPESYKANPDQSYRISGMSEQSLWQITEAEREFVNRRGARFWISLDVTLSLIKKKHRTTEKENTFTQNISEYGAAVYSSLPAKVGDSIKFACWPLDFHAFAIVRNVKSGEGENPTLHLEFVDARIPLDKILALQVKTKP